jgi:hypothetical protein
LIRDGYSGVKFVKNDLVKEQPNKEGSPMADDRRFSARTAGLIVLIGAALGVGAALLLASQSGSASRQRLRGYVSRTEEHLDEAADKAGEALDRTVDEGRGFMQETTSA